MSKLRSEHEFGWLLARACLPETVAVWTFLRRLAVKKEMQCAVYCYSSSDTFNRTFQLAEIIPLGCHLDIWKRTGHWIGPMLHCLVYSLYLASCPPPGVSNSSAHTSDYLLPHYKHTLIRLQIHTCTLCHYITAQAHTKPLQDTHARAALLVLITVIALS